MNWIHWILKPSQMHIVISGSTSKLRFCSFLSPKKENVFVWQTIFFSKNNHEWVYDDNKHHFWSFQIKVDRIFSLPVTSYDNSSHRSIPLCIEMIQTETALMRKRNKSDHPFAVFFEKNSINSHLSEKMAKNWTLRSYKLKKYKTTEADWTFKRIKFVFQIYLDVHEFVL